MAEVAQKAVKSVGDPFRVMMKIQVLDWKSYEVIPTKEVETLLKRILSQGEVSLAFVPYIDQFPLQQLKGKWTSNDFSFPLVPYRFRGDRILAPFIERLYLGSKTS